MKTVSKREKGEANIFRFFGGDESDVEDEVACLIRCPPEECGTDTCCPPVTGKLVDVEENDEHSHEGHEH